MVIKNIAWGAASIHQASRNAFWSCPKAHKHENNYDAQLNLCSVCFSCYTMLILMSLKAVVSCSLCFWLIDFCSHSAPVRTSGEAHRACRRSPVYTRTRQNTFRLPRFLTPDLIAPGSWWEDVQTPTPAESHKDGSNKAVHFKQMTSWIPYIKTSAQLGLSSVHQPSILRLHCAAHLAGKDQCGESKGECNYVSPVGWTQMKL